MSRWDEAAGHFNNAIEMDTRSGARPWVAHAHIDFARMLTARGAAGDRDRALRLVTQASVIYRELGMHVTPTERASRPERALERSVGQQSKRSTSEVLTAQSVDEPHRLSRGVR